MKGILWDVMVMILTLALFVALIPSAFGSAGEAIKISAKMNTEKLAGIINAIALAPSEAVYIYFLPASDCRIIISSRSGHGNEGFGIINYTLSTAFRSVRESVIRETMGLEKLSIRSADISCDENREKRIFIQRCKNEIRISENKEVCK
jgi:hypothetical protein